MLSALEPSPFQRFKPNNIALSYQQPSVRIYGSDLRNLSALRTQHKSRRRQSVALEKVFELIFLMQCCVILVAED